MFIFYNTNIFCSTVQYSRYKNSAQNTIWKKDMSSSKQNTNSGNLQCTSKDLLRTHYCSATCCTANRQWHLAGKSAFALGTGTGGN